MEQNTLKQLEFDKIVERVASFAVSEDAKRQLLEEEPSFSYNEVKYRQTLTEEASIVAEKYLLSPIVGFDPVDKIVEKAQKGGMLQPGELLKIAAVLKSARIARSSIMSTGDDVVRLKDFVNGLFIDESLEKDINIAIISENEISDNASVKLRDLRRKITSMNIKLKDKLASYTRTNDLSGYLQDNIVTIRNNRFVLPVKTAFKSSVPGLVHDQSASGSTVFIEPFVIVELNNELRTLQAEENAETERILYEFSKRVDGCSKMILQCKDSCTMLDIVFSKYRFSLKIDAQKPIVCKTGIVKLKQARHPLLDETKVIPIDIEIGDSFDQLLITGPNTGGKTVSLKTIGLFCLMTYYGLWVPAKSATVNVFDSIYCDIGDEQSIDNELSTFSSHMIKIIRITDELTPNSLVLLDEIGGGTDPTEGSALALGILDYIRKIGAKAVVTTHYNELKEYGVTQDRVTNGCMQFDAETFAPTYRLVLGMPGSSNALNIATRLGLNREIIDDALSKIDPGRLQFENLVKNAEELRNSALKQLEEISAARVSLESERQKLNAEAKKIDLLNEKIKNNAAAQTRKLVSDSMQKANEIIEEMEEALEKGTEGALLEAKKLRKRLGDIEDELNRETLTVNYVTYKQRDIIPGKECIVKSLNAKGVIRSVADKKGNVQVSLGSITTSVKADDLAVPPQTEVKKAKKASEYHPAGRVEPTTFLTELKVLGMTVDEAIGVIEPYLISMHNEDGNKTIKIVHGKGTMALAKGLHKYFHSSPLVAEFRFGRYGEGDNGVTFVTVK